MALDQFETKQFGGLIAVENNSFYPPHLTYVQPKAEISINPQSINLFDYKFTARYLDPLELG